MSSSASDRLSLPTSTATASTAGGETSSSSSSSSSLVASASGFGAEPYAFSSEDLRSSESGPSGLFSGTDGVLIAGKGKVKSNQPSTVPGGLIDFLQFALDVAGFIPGYGEIADMVNALISVLRGDYIGAALSLISCIPGAGDAIAKPIKFAIKAGTAIPAKPAAQMLSYLIEHAPDLQRSALGAMKGKIPGIDKHLPQIAEAMTKAINELRQVLSKALTVGVKWTAHGNKHVPEANGMAKWAWSKIVKNTSNGNAAMYKPGTNVQELEHIAFHSGLKDTTGRPFKVIECPNVIGASNGVETRYMRVELTQGVIHGHPIDHAEFLMRTK